MMGRRARSLEALALLLIIWVSARAAFVLWPAALRQNDSTLPEQVAIVQKVASPLTETPQLVADASDIATETVPVSARASVAHPYPTPLKAVPAKHDPKPESPIAPTDDAEAPFVLHEASIRAGWPGAAAKMKRRLMTGVWMLWRPDSDGVALGAAGQLGGSQAGVRTVIPIQPDSALRLSLRLSTSFGTTRVRELAPGLSVKPLAEVPVEFILERRLRAGATPRDTTALFAAGGVSAKPLTGTWTMDAYGQAGVVGTKERLWFADASAAFRRPIADNVSLGAGLWGGIQPGLKRVDIGPSVSARLAPDDMALRLDIDWRVRIAGSARPGSGVAVTLAKDF